MAIRAGKKAQPIAGIIERLVRSLGHASDYGGWLAVSQWPEIVGPEIAGIATAVRFSEGTLYVAVPDPSWRHELGFRREEILARIRRRPLGNAIKELRLVHGEKRTERL